MTFYEWFTTAPTAAEVKAQQADEAKQLEALQRQAAITAWRARHDAWKISDRGAWTLIEMARLAGREP